MKIPANASIRTTLRISREIDAKREPAKPADHVPNCGKHTVKDEKLAQIQEGGMDNPVYKQIHDGFAA